MRASPPLDRNLVSAYAEESELLMARCLPLASALLVAAVATSGMFESLYHPERLTWFLVFFGCQVAVCAAVVGLRTFLDRRDLLMRVVLTERKDWRAKLFKLLNESSG